MRKFVWIALVFFIILCCGKDDTTITINNPQHSVYPTPTYTSTPTPTIAPTATPVVTSTPTATPKPPKCKKIRIKYCTNYCRKSRRHQYKCCNWAHIKICK